MVADSIIDSELFYGSPISRDFSKKRNGKWLWKLKHWKIDARRNQWINQWKKTNVGEEENGRRLQSLQDKLTHKKVWKINHEEGSDDEDDDQIDIERISSATNPTSVLKSKDSVNGDYFCCSNPMNEEDEVFDDAFDKWDDLADALKSVENDKNGSPLKREEDPNPNPNPNTSQKNNMCKPPDTRKIQNKCRKKKKSGKQESDAKIYCFLCTQEMDATDLSFKPCSCGFQPCLFCHDKIIKDDGRCPNCRRMYKQTSDDSGQISYQQRERSLIRLSTSFGGLDKA